MTKITYKRIQSLLIILTLLILVTSFYLQYAGGLQPCPLCLMQRLCVFLMLILMGIRLGTARIAHVISFLQVVIAASGLFFACRQLWIQTMPASKAPACLPGLDLLIKYFPWQTVAKVLLWGTAECGEVTWSLWGISLAGWSALYFLLMLVFSILLFKGTREI